MRHFIGFIVVCSVMLFALPAIAQRTQQPGEVKTMTNTNADNGGYGYTFTDDPLNAGGFGPNDFMIKIRPKAARTTLIRPRVSFVPELLRTIEEL